MKRPVNRFTLLAAAAVMASGCVPVRHNLPPEQRLLEPGPGVGGPGPGVLGPIPTGGPMMGGMGPGMGGPMGGMGPGMGGPMMGGACGPGMAQYPPGAQMIPPGPPMPGQPMPGMMQGPMPGMMQGPMQGMMQGPMPGMMQGPMMPGPKPGQMMPPSMMHSQAMSGKPPAINDDAGFDEVGTEDGSDVALTNYAQCGPEGCGPSVIGDGGCFGGGGGIPVGGGVLPTMGMMPGPPPTVQVTFGKPDSMQVKYDATGAGQFDSEPLIVPARQNFPQGGLYRLKLTNIANREGVELYPTVELAYANPRTGAYLAHNSVPVQFTEEDLDQVLTGNFVTKVIYLPDPDYQGPALAGIDTLVSTRLDPGIDPITEADRRGSILAIIRLGDKDIEMTGCSDATGGAMGPGAMLGSVAGLPMPFAPSMTDGCAACAGDGGSCGPGGPGCGLGMGGMAPGGNGNGNGMPAQLPGMIAGVTAPQYGMPISGTPIGLPGPPHIPLGHPASLKKHVIKNHTHMHIPEPVDNVKIGVRLAPGYSYPNPVSRIHVSEQNIHPGVPQQRPHYDKASTRVR